MKNTTLISNALIITAVATACSAAFATEGGGSMGALPPTGFHALEYIQTYNADALKDNNGAQIPINFDLHVTAIATRFVWVTDQTVLGGQLAFQAIVPLVNLGVSVNGAGQTKSGIGDSLVGVGMGYHVSPNFHYVVAVNIVMPIGQYNKNDMVNLGRNYWDVEPFFAVTYKQADGINADIMGLYDINTRNKATGYTSGQEIHADYAIGWGFGKHFIAGVSGYIYQQVTDDSVGGVSVPNHRGRTMAIGPSIKYDNGKGWFITAKYQQESDVRNRPKGGGMEVKMNIPF